MRIWVFTICRNEIEVAPFYLRHYAAVADKLLVWDDRSDDGTREVLAACPQVELHDWPHANGVDEDQFLRFACETYPRAIGHADWVFWVDMDEFIYHPCLKKVLTEAQAQGYECVLTQGFNMVGDGFPKDDGRSQITEIHKLGVESANYSKPVVFQPTARMGWVRGKHSLDPCNSLCCPDGQPRHPVCSPQPLVKLLHYRYMGYAYTQRKSAKNYVRNGLLDGNKGSAWGCAPDFKGIHSADWAEQMIREGSNVVDSSIGWSRLR